jgi:hypothetical protein
MQIIPGTYGSAVAVTTSDTALISCRAIYVGGAGNVTVNPSQTGGTSVTFTAPPVGSIIPFELNQGRIMATGTTATLLVALA